MARFDDAAKEVMVQAQTEADSLKHNYVGTEHLMLAVLKRGVEGSTTTRPASEVVERIGEGDEPWIAGLPRPFTPRAKRALEAALTEATAADREQFGPEDILLAIAADPKGTGGEVLAALGVYTRAAARAARARSRARRRPRRRSSARAAPLLVRPPRRAARRPGVAADARPRAAAAASAATSAASRGQARPSAAAGRSSAPRASSERVRR